MSCHYALGVFVSKFVPVSLTWAAIHRARLSNNSFFQLRVAMPYCLSAASVYANKVIRKFSCQKVLLYQSVCPFHLRHVTPCLRDDSAIQNPSRRQYYRGLRKHRTLDETLKTMDGFFVH